MKTCRGMLIGLLLVGCGGCKRQTGHAVDNNYVDASIERLQALGWLGGQAHPATRTVQLPKPQDSDDPGTSGGMVVITVAEGGALAAAGARRGDVIVQVSDRWLPNKDNPAPDLMRSVEAEVSAGVREIAMRVLRDGKLHDLTIRHDLSPMELGLPGPSQRLQRIAERGLERLAALVQSEESSADPDARVAAHALAGLAFVAGGTQPGAGARGAALDICLQRVQDTLGDSSTKLQPWSVALATMFLAELAGPLEINTGQPVFAGTMKPPPGGMKMPEGMSFQMADGQSFTPPEGAVTTQVMITGDGEVPEGFDPSQLPEGEFIIGGDGGGFPEGFDLEQAQSSGSVMIMSPGGMPGFGQPPAPTAAAGEPLAEGPLWSMEELQSLAGEADLLERLQPLKDAVDRLVALQDERGSWDPDTEDLSYSQTSLMTNQALLALGMAQRAGVPAPGEVLRTGLQFLRSRTNDGHVHSVSTPGFDRRQEAGRASGAAAALLALNCDEQDEFLRELMDYSDDHASGLPMADGAVPLHILHTAVLSRQRGREAWAGFFEAFRDVIVTQQQSDGSFAGLPTDPAGDVLGEAVSTPVARTAVWSAVAFLPQEHVPLLLGQASHPLQPRINSKGERLAAAPRGPAMMPGQMMDPAQAREMLEKMGIDLDDILKNSQQINPGQQ